jgi:hypothetical protein
VRLNGIRRELHPIPLRRYAFSGPPNSLSFSILPDLQDPGSVVRCFAEGQERARICYLPMKRHQVWRDRADFLVSRQD